MKEQIFELLRTDQGFREEVRRQILTDDLLALPAKLDSLISVVKELAEAQRRTELALQRHDEQIAALIKAQERTEKTLQSLVTWQERTEKALQNLATWQERTEKTLQSLATWQERTEKTLQSLVTWQERTEKALQNLATWQERTEKTLQSLATWQERTERVLEQLLAWQVGEKGRRDGERYERDIIRRAPFLFNGGRGGAPDQPWVQQQLTDQLGPILAEVAKSEEDPFLADLLWWKGNRVIVAEISIQVNGQDVLRAAQRAETLKKAGIEAVPVVIGEEWAAPDAEAQATIWQVEWKVGQALSEGFLRIRQQP